MILEVGPRMLAMAQRECVRGSQRASLTLSGHCTGAAKRIKVDLDLTVSSSSRTTSTTRHSSTTATGTRTSTASTTVTASTARPAPKLASIFAPPAPSKGRWARTLGGTGKEKKGCGHYVWGTPKGSAKVAAFGASVRRLSSSFAG